MSRTGYQQIQEKAGSATSDFTVRWKNTSTGVGYYPTLRWQLGKQTHAFMDTTWVLPDINNKDIH